MKDIFVKKYWNEENLLFYLHFHDGIAIRQIEISPQGKILLTLEQSTISESMLYDQSLDELDLNETDFIKEEDFNSIWNNH